MTKSEYIDFCKSINGAIVDQPFNDDFKSYAARHWDTKKWFALIMELDGKDIVNLKCEPIQADFYRNVYRDVVPAYHMNKTHWNTVYLQGDTPDEIIKQMTLDSFMLTDKKRKNRKL